MAEREAAIKALGDRKDKAERILKLAELTRRFETEREKVLPFYESSVDEEELPDLPQVLSS